MDYQAEATGTLHDDRYTIPSLDRALRALELLSEHAQPLPVSAIASALGIPQNSAFRITRTLENRGYLFRNPGSKHFGLTPKLFAIGAAAAARSNNLIEAALEPMRRLRDSTRETVLLGTLLEAEGVVLEQMVGTHNFKFMVDPGLRFPLHTAAPGKAMLAALPTHECERILQRMTFQKFTAHTVTTRKCFIEELTRTRTQGYGIDFSEEEEGQHCIGAAILDAHSFPVGALWITAPASRLPESQFQTVATQVITAATDISRRLGNEYRSA
jgi:DNA-binding IclR family transcriptional regulator